MNIFLFLFPLILILLYILATYNTNLGKNRLEAIPKSLDKKKIKDIIIEKIYPKIKERLNDEEKKLVYKLESKDILKLFTSKLSANENNKLQTMLKDSSCTSCWGSCMICNAQKGIGNSNCCNGQLCDGYCSGSSCFGDPSGTNEDASIACGISCIFGDNTC